MAKKTKKIKKASNTQIRALRLWHEFDDFLAVQQDVLADAPQHLINQSTLVSLAQHGGQVIGAYDGEALVGGAVSFLGAAANNENRPAMANLKLQSELVFVREDYRNKGVAFDLKAAQYDFAHKRGIRLISWLFDPLNSMQAYLGLRKLGAIASRYVVDYYGSDLGAQPQPGSTDRFQADWWLTSWRVDQRLRGSRGALGLDQYFDGGTRILNPTSLTKNSLPEPSETFIQPPGALGLIEIPPNFERIQRGDPTLASAWREHVRTVFDTILGAGFVLTDFVREPYKGRQRSFYVCSHEGALRQIDQRFNQN
jgi:predicted GNAT superfamily acetyltransferase